MRFDVRRFFGTADKYAGAGHPLRRRLRLLSDRERREEARAFHQLYCHETGQTQVYKQQRWAEIRRELSSSGFYRHSPEELAFGARIAWRNHGRCIGRLFWESLEVADCRHITEPDEIAARMVTHMREAAGDGRVKSMISVFKPVEKNQLPVTIESNQIVQYAAYRQNDNSILGDRQNLEATRIAQSLGWQAPESPGMFDRLPLAIRDASDRRSIHSIPDECISEITIHHPQFKSIDALDLRWYTVPCISGMLLTIGGIDYPCAPFNGFYMGTEIGSRNFADKKRYDLLPLVATALDLDSKDPLWRDTALTELNRAVLHSYTKAGATMIDHHTASAQFMEFHHREQSQGRAVASDWRWIVPPQAAAITDVFHLKMFNFHPVPNYYDSRNSDGWRLMPFYGDDQQSRWRRNRDRLARRFKLWKRIPW